MRPLRSVPCDDAAIDRACKRASVNPKLAHIIVANLVQTIVQMVRTALDDFKGKSTVEIKNKLTSMPIPSKFKTDEFANSIEQLQANGDLNSFTAKVESIVRSLMPGGRSKGSKMDMTASTQPKKALDKQWLLEQAIAKVVMENPDADLDKVSALVSEMTGFSVVDCVQAITLMQVDGDPNVQSQPLQNDLDDAKGSQTPDMPMGMDVGFGDDMGMSGMDTPVADEMDDLGPDEFEMPASPDEVSIEDEVEDEEAPENSGEEVSVDEAPEENPVASLRLSSLKSGATTNEDVSRITSEPDLIQALENRKKRTTNPDIIAELDAAIAAAKKYRKDAAAIRLSSRAPGRVGQKKADYSMQNVVSKLLNDFRPMQRAIGSMHSQIHGNAANNDVDHDLTAQLDPLNKKAADFLAALEKFNTFLTTPPKEASAKKAGQQVVVNSVEDVPLGSYMVSRESNGAIASHKIEKAQMTARGQIAIQLALHGWKRIAPGTSIEVTQLGGSPVQASSDAQATEPVDVKPVLDSPEAVWTYIEENASQFEDANVAELVAALNKAGFSREVVDAGVSELLGPDATQALGTPVKVLLEK